MRMGFHLSPRVGWMNDLNGFSFYNGEYHMFNSITHMIPIRDRCIGDMR